MGPPSNLDPQSSSASLSVTPEYLPGICNIGPAETGRRKRAGHTALIASIALLVALIALDVPAPIRLVVALPAAGAASGYLQARSRFCAGFASKGWFNFGPLGDTQHVMDPEARRLDRHRALILGVQSAVIGTVLGILAALLPI